MVWQISLVYDPLYQLLKIQGVKLCLWSKFDTICNKALKNTLVS